MTTIRECEHCLNGKIKYFDKGNGGMQIVHDDLTIMTNQDEYKHVKINNCFSCGRKL